MVGGRFTLRFGVSLAIALGGGSLASKAGGTPAIGQSAAPGPATDVASNLFGASPEGLFAEPISDSRIEVRAAYAVTPATVALAANPDAVLVPRPDGGAPLRLTVGNFIPRNGFTFTEDGAAIPSDDPADLSYYWFGSGDGAEMSLTVREGAMHASVNGSGFSFGIEPTMVGQRHAFQDFDLAELRRKSCPAAPDVRRTAKPDVTIAARPSLAGAVALSPGGCCRRTCRRTQTNRDRAAAGRLYAQRDPRLADGLERGACGVDDADQPEPDRRANPGVHRRQGGHRLRRPAAGADQLGSDELSDARTRAAGRAHLRRGARRLRE